MNCLVQALLLFFLSDMEKRKKIWFSVPISTLIQAAEDKTEIEIAISYDKLMEQILDDNSSSRSPVVKKALQDLLSSDVDGDDEERMTYVECHFEQSFLKGLIENKEGYTSSVGWKDALFLTLDRSFYCLNIPPSNDSDDEIDLSDCFDDDDKENSNNPFLGEDIFDD